MDYKLTAPIAAEPLTLAEAKLHLRVDNLAGGTHPDDSLITRLIKTGRGLAEQYTGRAIATQSLEGVLDDFPRDDDIIYLPMSPAKTITHINYTNSAGGTGTMSPGDYTLSSHGLKNKIILGYAKVWPTTLAQREAVQVAWDAGFETTDAEYVVAQEGILLALAHWYKNREAVITGTISIELPLSARNVLDTIKLWGRTC